MMSGSWTSEYSKPSFYRAKIYYFVFQNVILSQIWVILVKKFCRLRRKIWFKIRRKFRFCCNFKIGQHVWLLRHGWHELWCSNWPNSTHKYSNVLNAVNLEFTTDFGQIGGHCRKKFPKKLQKTQIWLKMIILQHQMAAFGFQIKPSLKQTFLYCVSRSSTRSSILTFKYTVEMYLDFQIRRHKLQKRSF